MIKDPKERPSAADLLKHPFIKNAPDRKILAVLANDIVKFREEKRAEKEMKVNIDIKYIRLGCNIDILNITI